MNTYAASLFIIAAMIGVGLWLEHIGGPDESILSRFFRPIPMGIAGILLAIWQHMQ